jgi:cell division cycle 14
VDYAKQANAACLMGCFMIINLKKTAEEAWKVFQPYHTKFVPYRDATMGTCSYKCTILDCLRGLEYGMKLGWYNYSTFNVQEYQHYEKVENGDLNWIVPGKFIAFSGPQNVTDKYGSFTPDDYVPIFKKFGVSLVVRLNKPQYEKNKFVKAGIKHIDLYFLDGSTPPDDIVDKFLEQAESEKGAIAIHCKAGLGRTGSLIALYCMKHFGFPPAAFTGWIRIARPGSILGPQQQYLITMDDRMMKAGGESKRRDLVGVSASPGAIGTPLIKKQLEDLSLKERTKMTKEEEFKGKYGDLNQAENLLKQKYEKRGVGNSPKK